MMKITKQITFNTNIHTYSKLKEYCNNNNITLTSFINSSIEQNLKRKKVKEKLEHINQSIMNFD